MAVFAGGFTLEAVEEVCAGEGIERDRRARSAGLAGRPVAGDRRGATSAGSRYRLLETVRQYGLERLAEAGEEDAVRGRHRDFFLALAEEAAPQLETGRQREWLEVLDPEAANLAAAIDHALRERAAHSRCASARRSIGGGAPAAASPRPSWRIRARWRPAGTASPRCARACSTVARDMAIQAGEYEAAEAHATEALALAEEVGDDGTAARARCELGARSAVCEPAARASGARARGRARPGGG